MKLRRFLPFLLRSFFSVLSSTRKQKFLLHERNMNTNLCARRWYTITRSRRRAWWEMYCNESPTGPFVGAERSVVCVCEKKSERHQHCYEALGSLQLYKDVSDNDFISAFNFFFFAFIHVFYFGEPTALHLRWRQMEARFLTRADIRFPLS